MAAIWDLYENRAFAMEGFLGIFNSGQIWYKRTHFRRETLYCNFVQPRMLIYPTNVVLYPSHWQPPLTVPRQKTEAPFPLRCRPSLTYISSFPTKQSHKCTDPTPSSLQSRSTIPLTAIRFEFLYPCILFPNTGKIPDNMICTAAQPLLASSSSVASYTSQLSPLFLPCLYCSSRRVLVWSLHFLFP